MYGKDRLTKPLLRMTNGKYDKEGDFAEVSWDQAFDIMAVKFKDALKKKGVEMGINIKVETRSNFSRYVWFRSMDNLGRVRCIKII